MFRTLQPFKQQKISITKVLAILTIVCGLCVLSLYILALFPNFFRYKDDFLELSFSIVVATMILFLLTGLSYVLLKGKKGKLTGNLLLQENEIVLNDVNYPLSEIEKLRFIGNDVKGDFRGFQSKGTQNELIISLKNGQEIKTFFEQTSDNNLRSKKEILEKYHHQVKLSKSNFDNILNNTNYY